MVWFSRPVVGIAMVAMTTATLVAVGPSPAGAADNESPCITQAEWDAIVVGSTLGEVRAEADSPGGRLTWASPMKYIWKRCDGGGNGYAQIAFTQNAGSTTWRVSSKGYTPPAPAIKAGLSGLVAVNPAVIDGYATGANPIDIAGTIKVTWAQLEASDNSFNFGPITSVLNAHASTPFRIRVLAGAEMPTWLDNSDGGCVNVVADSANGGNGCVPQFWETGSTYRQRYQRLMRRLAELIVGNQQYDAQVVDVVNSACTTIFAEPFILGATPASKLAMWQQGYRFAGHRDCITWSTDMLTAMFPTTKISVAGHHKWQSVADATGQPTYDWVAERDYFDTVLRPTYGDQLVLEDHGLKTNSGGTAGVLCPAGSSAGTDWYCYLSHLGSADTHGWQFTFDSESPYADMEVAAELGADAGACYLESSDFGGMTTAQRQNYHNRLLTNCPSD
jgi:hypothetical protein